MTNQQPRLAFIDNELLDQLLSLTAKYEETNSPLEQEISSKFHQAYLSHGAYEIVLNYQRSAQTLKRIYSDRNDCAWAIQQGIPDNEATVNELRPIVDVISSYYADYAAIDAVTV